MSLGPSGCEEHSERSRFSKSVALERNQPTKKINRHQRKQVNGGECLDDGVHRGRTCQTPFQRLKHPPPCLAKWSFPGAGQRGEVCGGGLVTACVIAAGGCVGRRRAPAAAVDWRLLVAESSGRGDAPGPGYGPAAVAGGDCLVGGRRSSHAALHAAERTGPPLGSRLRLGPVCPRSGGRVRSSPPLLAGTRRLASPIKRGTEVWAGPGSPPRVPPARGWAPA